MKTFAVIDVAHCGTTMVAGCLDILGVPMVGRRYSGMSWEVIEIAKALSAGREAFAELARSRDGRTWGFKHPGAWRFTWLGEVLVEPIYLAIYKDPVSVARRVRQHGCADGHPLVDTTRRMFTSAGGIVASGLPVHWLSYGDAIARPRTFVEELAHLAYLAGVEASAARVCAAVRFIQPGGYGDVRAALERIGDG